MQGRYKEGPGSEVPGPGTYEGKDYAVKQSAPSYKIGTGEKTSKDMTTRREVPGPGQYSPESKQGNPAYK